MRWVQRMGLQTRGTTRETMCEKIKRLFGFTQTESNGLLAIVLSIGLLGLGPQAWKLYGNSFPKPIDRGEDRALLEATWRLLQNRTQTTPWDINALSAAELTQCMGIPPKTARRIVAYRNKLGGFASVDQYGEVYNLAPTLRERLVKRTHVATPPKKLSLNHATFRELVAHPYVSPDQAKAILAHRKKAGPFRTVAAVAQLPGYRASWGKKIQPYLVLAPPDPVPDAKKPQREGPIGKRTNAPSPA